MDKGTHVSAVHIPGKQNILSETASRKFHDASEWMLSKNMFSHLIACFGMPEIDIFASRLNKQLHRYASWMPDIYALSIDIMPISWENQFVCLFPMDMACCEQDIIGIDKNSCNSSNVANTIIVQKIVRSSSGAASDFQKQISENPRYISKTSSLSRKRNSERNNQCPQCSVERWNEKQILIHIQKMGKVL